MHTRFVGFSRWFLVSGMVAVAVTAPVEVSGQEVATRKNVISLNPLGIPFEYFSAEWEHVSNGLASFGLTGSYLGINDANYSTAEAKVRFYPNEEGPRGFSIGLSAGITHLNESFDGFGEDESETRPTIGVIVDYNWLLGKNKRFVVGVGVGAKRVLGTTGDYSDIEVAYPTARFQIGLRY